MNVDDFLQRGWNFVGNNAAAIVALCALGFTAYQTWATRRHNRLLVRPKLDLLANRVMGPNRGKIDLSIVNNGLGPAIIDSFQVTVDGGAVNLKVPSEVETAMTRLFGPGKRSFTIGTFAVGTALRKDEARQLLGMEFPATNQTEYDAVENQLNRVRVAIDYRSLYDEKFFLVLSNDDR